MKRIGLALGGGGARGLCHIEFIKALDDMGLKPSIVSGTSIGSIIGGFYAAGVSGLEMVEIIEKVGLREISKMVDFSILSRTGIVKGKGVEEFLDEYLPADSFEQLKIPLKIVATDYWERKEIIFESGSLIHAIRASISIPALFEPVLVGRVVMVDGGVMNPVPHDIISDLCDILIAIDVSGKTTPPKGHIMPNMFDSIMNTFQIMQASIQESKMTITRPDIYIKPILKNIQILDFHKDDEIRASVSTDVKKFKFDLEKQLIEETLTQKKKKRFLFFKY